ncbi:MAG TPA: dockerin type I domain-containing protein [Chthoniobacterales bacterium]|jgi:hypothetical protein
MRILLGITFCLVGLGLGAFALNLTREPSGRTESGERDMPSLREKIQDEAVDLGDLEQYWADRVTYPTGKFDPQWVRNAATQHNAMGRGIPAGRYFKGNGSRKKNALSTTSFTALGPLPEHMTGCSGCYDYGTTEGRVNDIVMDPTTTTNGSIVAYAASVGGGVWKTTTCCTGSTAWNVVTDDPLIATTSIDTITIDPNNHNTVYAGTGDLNYGSFSMGSQGILKSTDAGATWTVLGADVFGLIYTEPPGQYPQYNAVGKVRVDPNNSNNVMAGTKEGLYLSRDGGVSWTSVPVDNFTTQRQDITGLDLSDMGGGVTRITAAIGTRGFATPVQYDLGSQGANGIYMATMPGSGLPTFASVARNDNGFVFGTSVSGSPYTTGASMNAGTGNPYVSATSGNQLSRIDIAVAPTNPNIIYAQAGSIASNTASGCGTTSGCQLGTWATTDGGTTWNFMTGSAGGSLTACTGSAGSGDYPQNWYDQGIAVDPNNADRLYANTFDTWLVSRTGTSWYNTTCGYNGNGVANHVVHVDHHAQAFLPGNSDILLIGDDGGIHGTNNASSAISGVTRPTWFNMDTGLNAIEFYSGDISGNFATAATPSAVGGAQDNGPSSVTFSGTPTGPVQWQMGLGGDGFSGQIDPIGTGASLRYWEGNNSGGLSRCIVACTTTGAAWTSKRGSWTSDTQSFVLPINLFHGGIPGGDDCPAAGVSGGCGHLIAGTTRVWETITGNAASTVSWYVTNNPTSQNMTKQALGNRSYINQVKYSPKFQSVAIVGTNDGNVQIGFNLGTGTQAQANWVDVTGGNAILPNRPILGIALDPTAPTSDVPVGYASIGGFNENTPTTPGHLFQVSCASTCGSFTWLDKTGNLPDIPVDSVIVNPNYPQQVFAGTDFGLYYTNDITQLSPLWYRFDSGLPHAMIWDMQVDRGATTLSVWTRSRGAYVFPLPSSAILTTAPTLVSAASRMTHSAAGTFDLTLPLTGPAAIEPRTDGAGNYTIVLNFSQSINAGAASSSSGTVSNVAYSGSSMIISLRGIADEQTVTVTALNVAGVNTQVLPSASVQVSFLIGDVNGDGFVNGGDTIQVRNESGADVDATTFLNDVNLDGFINGGDATVVRGRSGDSLP